jgi:DNA-binding transcriptional MerR regulator
MKIGELARRSGVSPKAVRYYEGAGLLSARRLDNGYRDFDERDVLLIGQIRELASLGVKAQQARPFLECLIAGHEHGDDCPDSIAAYRAAIAELDGHITDLTERRNALAALLAGADQRAPLCEFAPHPFASHP